MAFTFTVEKIEFVGGMKCVIGTWNGASVTTGELDLSTYFSGNIYGVAFMHQNILTTPLPPTKVVAINETLPLDSGTAITMVFQTSDKGTFKAYGDAD